MAPTPLLTHSQTLNNINQLTIHKPFVAYKPKSITGHKNQLQQECKHNNTEEKNRQGSNSSHHSRQPITGVSWQPLLPAYRK